MYSVPINSVDFISYQEALTASLVEPSESSNGVDVELPMTNGDVNLIEENSNPAPDADAPNNVGCRCESQPNL